MSKGSKLEDKFLVLFTEAAPDISILRWQKVIKGRRFEFDFCLPDHRILVEIQGGTYNGGRHTRGYGYDADCEKSRLAQFDNWDVIAYTGRQITKENIERLIEYARAKVNG